MFNQITIIGFGLIGSSIARAVIDKNLAQNIVCVDQDEAVCNHVLALGIADEATTDASIGVEGSDLVILCCPVGAMEFVGSRIAGHLKQGAIVTDAGSVKGRVIEMLQPRLPAHVHLVPAHPISGAEKTGPDAGFAELFINRWCIITPLPHTELLAIELGLTSHLPHLIAYSVVGTATDLEDDIKSEVIKFSAGGFRDFTRLAASDPTMWRDVFLNNKPAVLEVLQRFTEDLTALQKAIRKGDGEYLYRQFTDTKQIRHAIVDAGQSEYLTPLDE